MYLFIVWLLLSTIPCDVGEYGLLNTCCTTGCSANKLIMEAAVNLVSLSLWIFTGLLLFSVNTYFNAFAIGPKSFFVTGFNQINSLNTSITLSLMVLRAFKFLHIKQIHLPVLVWGFGYNRFDNCVMSCGVCELVNFLFY